MSPDAKNRRRTNRREGRAERLKNAQLAECIKYVAITQSQLLTRGKDQTVWDAYEDLREVRK